MGKALEYADIEKARPAVKDHRCALVTHGQGIHHECLVTKPEQRGFPP